ncbi:MAG: RNA-binding protein [Hyphomicrobiaceae bacterium]|nr:RNA-binding protein [Hyphomicrobiaceae bacterium]
MMENGDTVEPDALGPETGPVRLCAVSRAHKTPDEMIRFVADPEGVIVPDLSRRLPGRGVWVEATRGRLEEALRKGVFARSLKRKVTVPEDLPARLERLLARRVGEALSLANKAGLVVAGFGKVEELIGKGRAAVLLHASDGALDGAGKLDGRFRAACAATDTEPKILNELTSEEMSLALGRMNVVHAAATEGGATRRLIFEAGRLRHFRTAGSDGVATVRGRDTTAAPSISTGDGGGSADKTEDRRHEPSIGVGEKGRR